MKPVYIFQHDKYQGPGYLGDVLSRNDIPYEVIATNQNIVLPGILKN